MIMDPVMQRLDVKLHLLDKSNEQQIEPVPEQNEEAKKMEELSQNVYTKDEDEHGVKRGMADELGQVQKKSKAESDLQIIDNNPGTKPDAILPSYDHSISNVQPKNVIAPKVEANESQSKTTDFYGNAVPLQPHMQQSFQQQQPYIQQSPYLHHQSPYGQQMPQHHQQYPEHQQYPTHHPLDPHHHYMPPLQQQQQQQQQQLPQQQHQQSSSQHLQQQHLYPQQMQPYPQWQQHLPYSNTQSLYPQPPQIPPAGANQSIEPMGEKNDGYDIKEKLKEMGEISLETVKKGEKKKGNENESEVTTATSKKTDEENATMMERKGNLRRNIREVMDETKLDESTLAAQRQEMERLRRVQEQQRQMRDLQRQANQDRVISILQGNDYALDGQQGPSTKIGNTVLVKLPNGQSKPMTKLTRKPVDLMRASKSPTQTCTSLDISPSSIVGQTNLTPSVSIAPVPKKTIETASISESDSEEEMLGAAAQKDASPVDVIDISSDDDDCIVVSETENDPEEDEDPTNSGMHTNDEFNQPDEQGRVVINIGHTDEEADIYLAPQIARIIKPHQIGGIRFLYDNIIESTIRYETSTGFGCILAHSMGLGKTLQVVTFSDIFLRHTTAKTILCIMPINTLQNWLAEYNMWLPTEDSASSSPLLVHGEVRPRNFNLHVLNDSHKTLAARAKVIHNWNTSGGVLLIGYEQYRLLSLRRFPKSRSKKVQQRIQDDDKNKLLFDEVHEALVMPGPDLVICDEGHRIKNSHASISQALKQMRTKRRVVLTGYPLQNNLMEYWCMVDFVRPNYLGSKTEFCNMFERPIQNGQCIDSTEADIKLMRYRAHVLHSLLLGFVQRRSHRVLQTALPQKEEYVLLVRMTDFQRTLYETFMNEVVRTQTVPNPLKAFAVCCKIWNHPDVLYYYLKKQDKGGAVDIDLEEVASVAPTNVTTKAAKPKVKKQSKKGKPAASVMPYSSNSTPVENSTTTTPANPVPNNSTTGNANPVSSHTEFAANPPNNFNPPDGNSSNFNSNSTISDHTTNNYRMNFNAPSVPNYPNNSCPMPPGQNFRANFNPPPQQQQYNANNQYMNMPANFQNQGGNYMNNSTRPAYPHNQTQVQENFNQQYPGSNYPSHQSSAPNTTFSHHGNQSTSHQPHSSHFHNYQNEYPHNQHNYPHQNPSSSNFMPPYNGPQSNYQNYPPNYTNNYQNQNYWNSHQQQQPHAAHHPDVKVESYYNDCRPYDGIKGYGQSNQWIKQEDGQPIKLENETKPKINIISDISIKNAYDNRGQITPEKKINILSDIKLEPKKEPIDLLDDVKKEESPDDQVKAKTPDQKVEKVDLDDESKSSSPVKGSKEDYGIPYDWAVELLKDYIPGCIENSAKMEILFSIVKESLALGDRLLVFSQSLITLDLIEQFLQMNIVPGDTQKWAKNTNYYRLDGSTTALEREKLINEFNSNPKVYLFLVSTRAGSLGINLIGANRVVVLDASWNPCHDTQAVCRVYRYGQRKPCFVYRLVVDNCLEKKIYDRQINKQGMSDRVVDECNPDAHLTMKDVTTLCWDDGKETEEKDWSYCKDKYIDVVLQKVLERHGRRFNKEPFQHESLLIDRKDKQLSSLEKRMAKRGYEREKQAARQPNYNVGTGIRHRPVASVRPMQQGNEARSSKWIPAEHWQRQGMTAQEMTLPLDVVIPTVQPDKGKIVLKAGQKVLILKSPKGVYMQLESGKIVSIKTAIKVRGKADEDSNKAKTPPAQPAISPPATLPSSIKNNSAISVTAPPRRAVKPFVPTPKFNIRARTPISATQTTPRINKKVQIIKEPAVIEEHTISSSEDERSEEKRLNYPQRDRQPLIKHAPHQDVHQVDGKVKEARGNAKQGKIQAHENFPKQQPARGASALQQLEKSTSAIISESKQPFQETLNSITSSYQENEPKEEAKPITIEDEPEDKTLKTTTQHQVAAAKPNIPPNTEYPYYYGYNLQPYSTPPTQPFTTYAQAAPPPIYEMSSYSQQPTQPPTVQQHQASHANPPSQGSQHLPHSQQVQSHQQNPNPVQQQVQQNQPPNYNYSMYPPHNYPTPAPTQYASQPYDYPSGAIPPAQPIYPTPYTYGQQYPPPPPQSIYPSTSNPSNYDYQYPPPPENAPTYYPPPT